MFQTAVANARADQDLRVPAGARRIGETLGGLGVYSAPAALREALETAGLEYGVWQCRSCVDGSVIEITGWLLP